MINSRERTKKQQEQFDKLPSSQFRELFISSIKKEIEVESKKKFPPFNKTKRERWIGRMNELLRDLRSGEIADRQLRKTKKTFEYERNQHILGSYLWIFLIFLVLGGASFLTIVLVQFA